MKRNKTMLFDIVASYMKNNKASDCECGEYVQKMYDALNKDDEYDVKSDVKMFKIMLKECFKSVPDVYSVFAYKIAFDWYVENGENKNIVEILKAFADGMKQKDLKKTVAAYSSLLGGSK